MLGGTGEALTKATGSKHFNDAGKTVRFSQHTLALASLNTRLLLQVLRTDAGWSHGNFFIWWFEFFYGQVAGAFENVGGALGGLFGAKKSEKADKTS